MKRSKSMVVLFWSLLNLGLSSSSKAQFVEKFDDGNLHATPIWEGDTSKFKVISGVLQSQNSLINDKFYLYTKSKALKNTQWEFFIKLLFNTSSANFVDVFLSSDSANILGKNSGYFIRIGNTSDQISLYKKTGNALQSLISGKVGTTNSSSSAYKLKIIYNDSGYFSLWRDSTGLGTNYVLEGKALDTTYQSSNYFGVAIHQSSASFHKKHFFDDFYCGKILSDTIAPWVKAVQMSSLDTFTLTFSEPIQKSALLFDNFELHPFIGHPIGSRFLSSDSSVIELVWPKAIEPNKAYRLTLKNCLDKANLSIKDTFFNLKWNYYEKPELHDIVMNEFMVDPDPSIGLPNHEFIELYNRSAKYIDLSKCSLSDKSTIAMFPKVYLAPDSFLIVCEAEHALEFKPYGKSIGLTNFPTLNNSGDELILRNEKGKSLHRVNYIINSYGNIFKQNGGWTLEMIDPNTPCLTSNYKASENLNGGTPGILNSIKDTKGDTFKPRIETFFITSDTSLRIVFSKALDSVSAVNLFKYQLKNNSIRKLICTYENLIIYLTIPLQSNTIYTLIFNDVVDCNLNKMHDTSIIFALPEKILEGDIIINEVLFNPQTGGSDFIELLNHSNKILSLKNLYFFNFDENNIPKDVCVIDTSGLLFLPQQILAFTINREWTINQYKKSKAAHILKVSLLPTLNDTEGYFGIANANGDVLDKMAYSENMHLQLLTNFEGVSLERIRAEVRSQEPTNWTSAAVSYGSATPGLKNSHEWINKIEIKDWLHISPNVFSPDQDGLDDIVSFTITTDNIEQQATLIIFDCHGQLIRAISNNMPIGNSQTWFWDGTHENDKKAPIGIYIVYAELFGLNGKRQVLKKSLTLGGK